MGTAHAPYARTAHSADDRKVDRGPRATVVRSTARITDTHLPSQHSPPRGGCRGAGGACERGRSALCAAWMRAQRVLPRRAALRGAALVAWSVVGPSASTQYGRRVRTPAGRWVSVMAAGDVSSMGLDARARRPLCVLTRADRRRNRRRRPPFGGANFVRIDYRVVVRNGMQILFESIA